MIKTPLSTVIGGAGIWTPGCTVISGQQNLTQLIKSLFSNNEVGFAYDPNDLSTLYQDAAGTIPVTSAGQPVGLMLDKSGRGNHARQTTSASRPILRRNATTGAYYLEFDGTDDFLVTNSIDFTATDKVSLFAGVRKLSDASAGMVCELGSNVSTTAGTFFIAAPPGALAQITAASNGTVARFADATNLPAPISTVISVSSDITANTLIIRANGTQRMKNTISQGAGKYANYPLYIGRRGGTSTPFNGHLYSLIGIGRLTTDSETIALEKSIAKNTGVTLSV